MTTSRPFAKFALTVAVASGLALLAPRAGAQSPEDLKAARELFQDAYKDEQAKRFQDALEKFRKVAKVRESASVRYRIATCLEGLGRLREARDEFRSLAASKPQLNAQEKEIADSAAERVPVLDKKIPRLVLKLQEGAPDGARVTIDGSAVPVGGAPLELDPGDHVVQASAPGTKAFEQKVTLETGETTLPVTLDKAEPPPPVSPTPTPEAPHDRTVAYVTLAAGGVLVVTSAVLLFVREGDVSDIKTTCPGGTCPASRRDQVERSRDEAALLGPLGGGFAATGVVALGVGTYLLLRHPSSSSSPASSPTSAPAANLRLGPRVVRGGVILGVGSTF